MLRINWQKQWTREYSINKMEVVLSSLNSELAKKLLGARVLNVFTIPENKNESLYQDQSELNKFLERIYQRLCASKSKFRKFLVKYQTVKNKFINYGRFLNDLPLEKYTDKKFISLFDKSYVIHKEAMLILQWIGFCMANYLSIRVLQELKTKIRDESKVQSYLRIIFSPDFPSQIIKEHYDLLKLAVIIKKNKLSLNQVKKLLYQHTENYQWIPCLDINDKPWSVTHFQNELTRLFKLDSGSELKHLLESFKRNKVNFNRFIKDLRFSARQKELFRVAHQVAFYKDDRDDARRLAYFYWRKLFIEVASRLDLSLKQLGTLLHREIIYLLTTGKKPDYFEITKRFKNHILLMKKGKLNLYFGNTAKKVIARELIKNKQNKVLLERDIKGIIGSLGKAIGKVSIVLVKKDLTKVKRGDIMIAITTHPDFVPAMRRAKAIVTDEGGITCHAAIISRELKKPCIIGTKIATKVLKDGDLVEVDAINGIVRKL
ncbi:MAG: PEP-utilizing enzyme [Patescibacteria group bacterium]